MTSRPIIFSTALIVALLLMFLVLKNGSDSNHGRATQSRNNPVQTIETATHHHNLFLQFGDDAKPFFLKARFHLDALDSLRQELNAIASQLYPAEYSWQQGFDLQDQLNNALAKREGLIVDETTFSYLSQLGDIAEQTQHYFNPALGRLIHESDRLEKNQRPINFSEVRYWGEGIYTKNTNIQVDLSITQSAWILSKMQQLLKGWEIDDYVLGYAGMVINHSLEEYVHLKHLTNAHSNEHRDEHGDEHGDEHMAEFLVCPGKTLSYRLGKPLKLSWEDTHYYTVDEKRDVDVTSQLDMDAFNMDTQGLVFIAVTADDPVTSAALSWALLASANNWQQLANTASIKNFMRLQLDQPLDSQLRTQSSPHCRGA